MQLTFVMRTVVTCGEEPSGLVVDVPGLLAGVELPGEAPPDAGVPPTSAAKAEVGCSPRTPSSSATNTAARNLDRLWAPVLAKITKNPFASNGPSARAGRLSPPDQRNPTLPALSWQTCARHRSCALGAHQP